MNTKQNLSVIVANPAGNITIFVLTPVAQKQYMDIATKLLAIKELQGEQVGFIKNYCLEKNMDVRMEMSGFEFCGNASRSFALFVAKQNCIQGATDLKISVSGALQPIDAYVNTLLNTAKISMPLPLSVETLSCKSFPIIDGATLIKFDGIIHLILENIEANIDIFDSIKDILIEQFNPAGIGVMFYDTKKHFMTPVVYVKNINSTYFEGSCGSGTTALSIALSKQYEDGIYSYIIKQPKGILHASIEKHHGKIEKLYIDGPVSFSEIISVEI